jgi:hypothetical protein
VAKGDFFTGMGVSVWLGDEGEGRKTLLVYSRFMGVEGVKVVGDFVKSNGAAIK